jgi:hypothetical protein
MDNIWGKGLVKEKREAGKGIKKWKNKDEKSLKVKETAESLTTLRIKTVLIQNKIIAAPHFTEMHPVHPVLN